MWKVAVFSAFSVCCIHLLNTKKGKDKRHRTSSKNLLRTTRLRNALTIGSVRLVVLAQFAILFVRLQIATLARPNTIANRNVNTLSDCFLLYSLSFILRIEETNIWPSRCICIIIAICHRRRHYKCCQTSFSRSLQATTQNMGTRKACQCFRRSTQKVT